MEPKRARTHAVSAHDDHDCENQSSDDWDLADYRRQVVHIQNRRSVVLGSRADVPTPQKGQTGPLSILAWGLWDGLSKEHQFTVPGQGIKQRYLHVVACAREERDCEVLRVWVLKGLFCQWMMTLNSGHDVSE
jgi:hypothetical protein